MRPDARLSSWRQKLSRAERHLRELDAVIERYGASGPARATRAASCTTHRDCWRFLVEMEEPPDSLVLIVGDAVHNLRTALDHLAVAIAPKARQRVASFPITSEDIDATSPTPAEAEAKAAFERATTGMAAEAIGIIKDYQPFHAATEIELRTHALAIISRIDNADKHRQLAAVSSGMADYGSIVTARGQILTQRQKSGAFASSGAEVAHFADGSPPFEASEVRVEVIGRPVVAVDVGIEDGLVDVMQLRVALDYVRDHVVPDLETFARRA